jgi:hypothetical protein
MIAAFGLPHESEQGVMTLAENQIAGVHLTRLTQDGSDRKRNGKSKMMIGFSRGRRLHRQECRHKIRPCGATPNTALPAGSFSVRKHYLLGWSFQTF